MTTHALVDFDDTLVDTGPRFRSRREALFDRMESLGFPREEAWRIHHEVVDRELLSLWGYGPFRLGASFRDTYLRLCADAGRPHDPLEAREAEWLAKGIESPPPLLPGALDHLSRLARHHPVAIYTQSSYPDYQRHCVEASGVLGIVPRSRLVITPEKSDASYLEAVKAIGAGPPERTCMIGNSVRSDVNPALRMGARAIWIDAGEPWHHDRAELADGLVTRVESFPDAVDAVLDGPDQANDGGRRR